MADERYLIRYYSYGYNDECYYVEGARVESVHDDLEDAKGELERLEVAFLRGFDQLGEHESFFDAPASRLLEADRFVFEKSGEHLFEDWQTLEKHGECDPRDASIPDGMSDEDLLELGRIADLHGHELLKMESGGLLHVVWDSREDEPVLEHDEGGAYLLYAASPEALVESAAERLLECVDGGLELDGTAAGLSESPAVLEKLVESTRGLSWNRGHDVLRVGGSVSGKKLRALNALLRVPLIDVREMEPDAVAELEERFAWA